MLSTRAERFFACTAGIPNSVDWSQSSDRRDRSPSAPVVRRPTGGRAVWHETEVTYAVTAPIATSDHYGRRIEKSTLVSPRHCGPWASTPYWRRTVRPSDVRPYSVLFRDVGWGEILANHRKLVGSSAGAPPRRLPPARIDSPRWYPTVSAAWSNHPRGCPETSRELRRSRRCHRQYLE